jgi:hypothetical protein
MYWWKYGIESKKRKEKGRGKEEGLKDRRSRDGWGKKGGRNGVKEGSNPGDKESGVIWGKKVMVERRAIAVDGVK